MLKLFSLKNQQQKDGTPIPSGGGMQKKASAAQLRVTKGKSNEKNEIVINKINF